jgi:hypothetical protein
MMGCADQSVAYRNSLYWLACNVGLGLPCGQTPSEVSPPPPSLLFSVSHPSVNM